jgi:predicted nucleic acid-binding protein
MTARRKLVLDASVVVKLYVPETGSDAVADALEGARSCLAPDLVGPEVANALWKKVQRAELSADEAREIVDAFARACPVELRPSLAYLAPALEIAQRHRRTVYDSLYLALAVAEGCQLLTADRRFAVGLAGSELAPFVRVLEAAATGP